MFRNGRLHSDQLTVKRGVESDHQATLSSVTGRDKTVPLFNDRPPPIAPIESAPMLSTNCSATSQDDSVTTRKVSLSWELWDQGVWKWLWLVVGGCYRLETAGDTSYEFSLNRCLSCSHRAWLAAGMTKVAKHQSNGLPLVSVTTASMKIAPKILSLCRWTSA